MRRLITAGLCALGLAGLGAGTASAELPYLFTPAKIQIWSSAGLTKTIVCETTKTAPGCDYDGLLDGKPDSQIPLLATYVLDVSDGGYRILDPRGKWYQMGGTTGALAAIAHADATHGPGWALAELDDVYLKGPHALDGYTNQSHINDHITEAQQLQEEQAAAGAQATAAKRHTADHARAAKKRHTKRHRHH
jgi:hypothetical protein